MPNETDQQNEIQLDETDHHVKPEREPVSEPGTVLRAFNGRWRRFPVGAVVTEADVGQLPMSIEDLKSRGLISS